MSIDEELFSKIKELTLKLHIIQKQVINEIDISPSEYKVLSILALNGELTQTTLSEVCYMDKPATSRIIRKMNSASLINKKKKAGNKKVVYISLTEKGKLLANEIKKKNSTFKENKFKALNDTDKQTLLNLIDKILV